MKLVSAGSMFQTLMRYLYLFCPTACLFRSKPLNQRHSFAKSCLQYFPFSCLWQCTYRRYDHMPRSKAAKHNYTRTYNDHTAICIYFFPVHKHLLFLVQLRNSRDPRIDFRYFIPCRPIDHAGLRQSEHLLELAYRRFCRRPVYPVCIQRRNR